MIAAFHTNSIHADKESNIAFTELDLFDTDGLSGEFLRKRALEVFGKSENQINKKSFINELNSIYAEAVEFLGNSLKRNVPNGLKEKSWKDFDEFMLAVENHTKKKDMLHVNASENAN